MIAFVPSATNFLSALINFTCTYFGLTFSLIGQESAEEYLGARKIHYYSKEKNGANFYKKCHFLEATYNDDPGSLAGAQFLLFCSS